MTRSGRIRDIRFTTANLAKGDDAALGFIAGQRSNRRFRRVSVDAFANQLTNEPPITDGFTFTLGVKCRIEPIVDEAFALAAFNGIANRVVVVPLALQPLP